MYSGSESGDSQKLAAQWPLNPAAYQNMAADQVDWAALAQQWIIMKEAGPPPVLGDHSDIPKHGDIVGGEAPMEVESANDDAPSWGSGGDAPPAPGAEAWSNWNSGSWGWGSSWSGAVAPPPPPITSGKPPPLLPTPTYPTAADDNAVPFSGYTTGPHKNKGASYWNAGTVVQKEIKPHNKRYSKVNVPIKAPVHIPPPLLQTPVAPPADLADDTPTLDAAKRKQLPAWIREGLEKMEKDKLRQMQKDRENQAMEEYKEKAIQSEKERLEVLKNTMKEEQIQKSRFDSDGDESDKEEQKKRTRSPEPPVELTAEEKILKVRRTMTEILLKTTSKFIDQICREEHQRYMKKRRASAQLGSAPSGAVLSAKLGLGAYNHESSSSSDSESEENDRYHPDSDAELKENIRRKMADFSRIEREIEDRLAKAENQKEEGRSRSSTPDSRGNDSQVDETIQEPKHHKPENKNGSALELKNKSVSRSSSESSDYNDGKRSNRRRSTSSNDSPKKTMRKDSENHRDRSETDGGREYSEKTESGRRRSDTHQDHLEKPDDERRRSNSYRDRSESRSSDRKYKYSRQSSRYSETPEKKRRSRSRSSRRDSTESKMKSRRSDESVRSSRRSHRSHKTRSRSRSSSYHRKSSKKSSRRSRSSDRSRSSRQSSKKSRRRSRSYSESRSRRRKSKSGSRSRRRHSRSSSSSEDRYSSRGKRSHRR